MLSYDLIEHGQPLQARLRATPNPTGREVLVRITHSGLCHSDLHMWEGFFDLGGGRRAYLKDRGQVPPMTLGHEPLGVVVAVGDEVTSVTVGDKRIVFPWIGCGQCWACEAGLNNVCNNTRNIGIARPGAFATHLLVPDDRLLVDSSGIDDAIAATLACSGVTAHGAAAKLLPHILPGDWVAVVGCGGVGLVAVAMLQALGVDKVIACDIDDSKLAAARTLGAARTVRTDAESAAKDLMAASEGRLVGAIDFVGTPRSFAPAYAALRKGGHYVLVGLHGGELTVPMPPVAQRSVAIAGSFVGTLADLHAVVALARSGRLQPLPTTTRDAREINAALDDLNHGRVLGRTVLDFSRVTETEAG